MQITFDLARRDILLVYFFAALGLRSSLRELITNGRPLFILVALASLFIVPQNIAGIMIARAFDHDPQIGIVAGSMALIGRSGRRSPGRPFLSSSSTSNTLQGWVSPSTCWA